MSLMHNSGRAVSRHESTDADGEVFATEIVPVSALESVTRAEIDVQIATAKRFPRSMAKFLSEARGMVGIDPELAAQCTYYLPGRSKNAPPITGPSVRLAEICAVCYGNLRVVGRITDDDGKFVTAQAVAMDLERNVGYSVETKRGVTTKEGRRYGDDMLKTTANAAIAIATRNATFKVIPQAFVNLIEDEAKSVARGDVKTMPERTAAALAWFAGRGVPETRVFAALGINGPADMTLDLLVKLQGLRTAVKDGQASVDELFPPMHVFSGVIESVGASKAERLAGKLSPNPKAEAPPEPDYGVEAGDEPG